MPACWDLLPLQRRSLLWHRLAAPGLPGLPARHAAERTQKRRCPSAGVSQVGERNIAACLKQRHREGVGNRKGSHRQLRCAGVRSTARRSTHSRLACCRTSLVWLLKVRSDKFPTQPSSRISVASAHRARAAHLSAHSTLSAASRARVVHSGCSSRSSARTSLPAAGGTQAQQAQTACVSREALEDQSRATACTCGVA